jgi:hypothetical protein
LTKDGETKSTERRNADHDDGNKKLIKSESDEKDSLNDKTVTFKPDNNALNGRLLIPMIVPFLYPFLMEKVLPFE